MRLTAPLYEGDSLLRSGPAFGDEAAPEVAPPAKPVEVFELTVADLEARARTMRARYVGEVLQRAWAGLEAWVEKGRRNREEAYLSRAQNLSDLEDRMRKLERDGYVPHV